MKGVENNNRILKATAMKKIKKGMGIKKVRGKGLKLDTKHVRVTGR